MRKELAAKIVVARAERRAVALLTWLANGEQRLIEATAVAASIRAQVKPESGKIDAQTTAALPELVAPLVEAFHTDRSGIVETSRGEVFIRIYNPPARLVIIGAVRAAQFLVPLARMLGYEVVIVDPRTSFATDARFPDAHIVAGWPEDALPSVGLDARTAVVALTHDARIDDSALRLAMAAPVFYIGALGTARMHAERLARLKETATGFGDEALVRIHGPAGLDIGAQGPAEIALSVMAQVTAALRGKL